MLGVGKAAPAQFILRGKTNLRRISAAGQKAGFTAYPSHWASIWRTLGTSEQASYRLLRLFLQKSQSALIPLLLLFNPQTLCWFAG